MRIIIKELEQSTFIGCLKMKINFTTIAEIVVTDHPAFTLASNQSLMLLQVMVMYQHLQ